MILYLLSIEELNDGLEAERLYGSAMQKLDAARLEKVRRCRAGQAGKLALGAGLLLQLAVQEGMCQGSAPEQAGYLPVLTVRDVLKRLGEPAPVGYRYGAQGKPDFDRGSWHFNLSHSGQYACCVLDREEVGLDIQQMRPLEGRRPAERFFSPREREALLSCGDEAERERLFYRIWVRKESYAKLTGEGIAAAVAQDTAELKARVAWQEYGMPEGYCMALCRYRPTGEL